MNGSCLMRMYLTFNCICFVLDYKDLDSHFDFFFLFSGGDGAFSSFFLVGMGHYLQFAQYMTFMLCFSACLITNIVLLLLSSVV